jgi:hypothetical protein
MAGGYFDDGIVSREIGEHAFATPSPARRNIILDPHGQAATVHDSGGGVISLDVTGQRLRENLGDAERYAYDLFVALALTDPGDLGVEDQLGHQATFAQAVCTGAAAEVQAFRMADMRFEFLSPEKAAEPAWGAIPAAPGTYPGTDTLLDYAAGGVGLGTHPAGMGIEMARSYPLREIPRARGSRSRGPERGATMRFTVTSHAVASGIALARYLEDLARQIGPRPVDLTANGNIFADVVLDRLTAYHTDRRATRFTVELIQQL